MWRHYVGESYDLLNPYPALAGMTTEQIVKVAVAEILAKAAHRMELELFRGDAEIPTNIRVEVIQERWDLHVCLHLEGGEGGSSNQPVSDGDTQLQAVGG